MLEFPFRTHPAKAEQADSKSHLCEGFFFFFFSTGDFLPPASWICAAGKYNQRVGRHRQDATGLLTD